MTEAEIQAAIFAGLATIAPEADAPRSRPMPTSANPSTSTPTISCSFLIALSGKLGVEIPEADYAKLATLESMTAYLAQAVAQSGKP